MCSLKKFPKGEGMAKIPKSRQVPTDRGEAKADTRVIYLNLPCDVAALLEAEAEAEDRPISVQAGRIIKQYFEKKS